MIALLLPWLITSAYLTAGIAFARRDLPQLWAGARRRYVQEKHVREVVRRQTVITVLFWPTLLAVSLCCGAGRLFRAGLDAFIDKGDPEQPQLPLTDLRLAAPVDRANVMAEPAEWQEFR